MNDNGPCSEQINEKSVWMDGARHGADVGLDLAIKILTEFRDSMRKKFDEAQETEGAK